MSPAPKILCVAPNPAIDHTLIVERFTPFEVNRAQASFVAAGGKGFNVARALSILGEPALCMGFMGGADGQRLVALAEAEGLPGQWTWLAGESRTCVIVADLHSGQATVVNERGPTATESDWRRLHEDVLRSATGTPWVCFSGSLPAGSPVERFTHLLADLCRQGNQVWVDTSGAALSAALSVPGVNIKVNESEARALLTQAGGAAGVIAEVEAGGDVAALTTALRERTGGAVVVTLGAAGAVMATVSGGMWRAAPPPIKVVSAVGSGDSFLAGVVCALVSSFPPSLALRWGVAAGAANALSAGGGRFALADFEQLSADTSVSEVSELSDRPDRPDAPEARHP
jgi:1-phosphofructokinase family hexose kinase